MIARAKPKLHNFLLSARPKSIIVLQKLGQQFKDTEIPKVANTDKVSNNFNFQQKYNSKARRVSFQNKDNDKKSYFQNKNKDFKHNEIPKCTFCHKLGHKVERCYLKYGKPENQ